jgi:kynurenine formamidase
MRIDLTLKVNVDGTEEIMSRQAITAFGHLGTHVDVIGKAFSLDNFVRRGLLIDISSASEREIGPRDLAVGEFKENDFALLYTGFIDRVPYGTPEYFQTHPELSMQAVEYLLRNNVSLIGIDSAGLRRGEDHQKVDRLCAEKNVFVVENLVNLKVLIGVPREKEITLYTLAVNFEGLTGLPCRVVAEV